MTGETLPLPGISEQKAGKSSLQAVLIGHTKLVGLPEATWYKVETGVLVWSNSLIVIYGVQAEA
jgi:hypothetical protein